VIRRGDIVWCDFGLPRDGSAPAGIRPCIVAQTDGLNLSSIGTAIGCTPGAVMEEVDAQTRFVLDL
jgi:mRNA-degrading endonuclease toxin of MazEF toxin-antitoxin module